MTSRIPKRLVVVTMAMAVAAAASSVGAATGLTIGADEGHGSLANSACKPAPIGLTMAVGCSDGSPVHGQYLWQIPLATPAASTTATALAASVYAEPAASIPTSARLIAWSSSGVLVCATSGATWNGSQPASSKSMGSCTRNWQTHRAEVEVWIGHMQGLTGNSPFDGRVWSATYTY